jgi:branched-chain amino acid transport system permease protein
MRASAQDKGTSALMGVNVNRVIALTFLIGSAMGALAGGLYGAVYHFARPDMGFIPGLKAFIAAVLGGIGNIPGAFLGGILLGMIESLGAAYISSQYRDAFAFVVLILLLSFRPSGLLGSPISEKA